MTMAIDRILVDGTHSSSSCSTRPRTASGTSDDLNRPSSSAEAESPPQPLVRRPPSSSSRIYPLREQHRVDLTAPLSIQPSLQATPLTVDALARHELVRPLTRQNPDKPQLTALQREEVFQLMPTLRTLPHRPAQGNVRAVLDSRPSASTLHLPHTASHRSDRSSGTLIKGASLIRESNPSLNQGLDRKLNARTSYGVNMFLRASQALTTFTAAKAEQALTLPERSLAKAVLRPERGDCNILPDMLNRVDRLMAKCNKMRADIAAGDRRRWSHKAEVRKAEDRRAANVQDITERFVGMQHTLSDLFNVETLPLRSRSGEVSDSCIVQTSLQNHREDNHSLFGGLEPKQLNASTYYYGRKLETIDEEAPRALDDLWNWNLDVNY